MMKRIMFITTGLRTGGAETHLLDIIKGLDRSLFSSCVISLTNEGEIGKRIISTGTPVYELNLNHLTSFVDGWILLAKIIHRERPDRTA